MRKNLEAPYTGPFEVVSRKPKYFVLKLPQGETTVSIGRLKPAVFPKPKKNKHVKPPPPVPVTNPPTAIPTEISTTPQPERIREKFVSSHTYL